MRKEIIISGVIGSEKGQYSLIDFLSDISDAESYDGLDVIIDSVGGSVQTGDAIAERLNTLPNTRTIAKKVFSIATKIFLSGKEKLATPSSQFMIHNPFVMDFEGDKDELRKVADMLEATEHDLEYFYTNTTGLNKDDLSNLMQEETFFDADKAVKLGFADKVQEYNYTAKGENVEFKAVAMLREVNQSFNDYPQAAAENARKAIKFKEERKELTCGTQVGWIRANQLANNENLSVDTIGRMAQFERFRRFSADPYLSEDGQVNCGRVMWDAWGGDEGVDWAKRKLEQIKNSNINIDTMANESVVNAFNALKTALGFTSSDGAKNELIDASEDVQNMEEEVEIEEKEKNMLSDEELAKIAEMVTEMLKPQFEGLQEETLAQAKNSAEEVMNLAKEIRTTFKPPATTNPDFKAKGSDAPEVSSTDAMWSRMAQRAEKHRTGKIK